MSVVRPSVVLTGLCCLVVVAAAVAVLVVVLVRKNRANRAAPPATYGSAGPRDTPVPYGPQGQPATYEEAGPHTAEDPDATDSDGPQGPAR